jgi:hypothetical protein
MLDENGEIVPPNELIPAAERYGSSAQIDCWVIETFFSNYHNLLVKILLGKACIAILNDYTRYQEEPGNAYPEALPPQSGPRQSLWTSVPRLCLEVKLS